MSSLGLPSRTASALAYSGWWLTGAIFWLLEREDRVVRFHAAQSIVVFGVAALAVVILGVLAAVSLSFLPSLFGFFVGAAVLIWVGGVILWVMAMWKIVSGDEWRLPVAARWVERLNALPATFWRQGPA
jgi:uncharacterized membrane protein